jgi:DNA polymerase I
VRRRGHPCSAKTPDLGTGIPGTKPGTGPGSGTGTESGPETAAPERSAVERLRGWGIGPGDLVAVAVAPGVGVGVAAVAEADVADVVADWSGSCEAPDVGSRPAAVPGPAGPGPAGPVPVRFALAADIDEVAAIVGAVDDEVQPRWVWWSIDTAIVLVRAGVRVARCWDVAAVARLLFGGSRADPALVWAQVHDLPLESLPAPGPLDLLSLLADDGPAAGDSGSAAVDGAEGGAPGSRSGEAREHPGAGPGLGFAGGDGGRDVGPVGRGGHLRSEWVAGGWASSPERLARWADLALEVATRQQARLDQLEAPKAAAIARSESAAELLCAELAVDGLPIDRAAMEQIVAGFVGPRPRTETEAAAQRARRDAEVLRHAPPDSRFDLRSPGQVKSLLRRVGVEVADTRAWRLEALREAHPVVDALLAWRKAERVATTYGYGWLDEHLDADGRLRGVWSAADGGAGRMTASAGLHNMPADLRGGVVAEAGHVFVRADLGQIEPRVLAAVSGDGALAEATAAADMYAPVARHLGVDRDTAKVAVLGAMYGQTTGHGAQVLRRLEAAYPVAMAYLEEAARAGQVGRALRTYGGRLVAMGPADGGGMPEREARARAAARGRYARNALVQGAAAELFKMWAVTVRARAAELDARVVLCLHDELLVHAPVGHAEAVAVLVDRCLQEAAHRWAPDRSVRFVAETGIIRRWSDAKG